jgi:Arylsulfotransferase (ASST)
MLFRPVRSLVLCLAACGPTDPLLDGAFVSASCAADPANAVRATCGVELAEPAALEVELTDGQDTVVFSVDAPAMSHEVPLWGLTAAAQWSWTARSGDAEVSGTFQTGSLPAEADVLVEVEEIGASTVEMMLVPASCATDSGWAVVLDPAGAVRWYADLRGDSLTGRAGVLAAQYTEDNTVIAILAQQQWVEYDLLGQEVVRVLPALPVHHDLFRRDGRTYVLLADAYPSTDGNTYVEDQVAIYEGESLVETWEVHDHLVATPYPTTPNQFWQDEFPGAIDAWHMNGLYVTESEEFLLSSLRLGSLFLVRDREIAWVLGGDDEPMPVPSSFTFVGDGDPQFNQQHHPSFDADGNLLVFDNSAPRGLALSLDEAAGAAQFVGDWPVTGPCDVQGSVFTAGDGHHLVSCTNSGVTVEFDAAGERVATWGLSCPSGPATDPVRVQPIDLWTAAVAGVQARRVE